MSTDAQLLRRYVEQQDEHAFAELVHAHLGLVYTAALRRCNGRAVLAEEVAQQVFSALARKASGLLAHPSLTGWLYRSTRFVCIDALRAEQRRLRLAERLTHMQDEHASPEQAPDWEQLRPLLDEAMDKLREGDRELMLLRFFEGKSYAEVGAQCRIAENTARMRTERALERLRLLLERRGLSSSSAALGLLLANQAFGAAPQGLASSISSLALAQAQTGLASGAISLLFMSKLTAPALTALAAAVVTVTSWKLLAEDPGASLAALQAENARLLQATAPNASVESLAAAARDYGTNAFSVAAAVRQRHTSLSPASNTGIMPDMVGSGVGAHGHRNRGQATPHDAFMSFAWAADACDEEEMSKLVWFDTKERARAFEILSSMPDDIRARYGTPEAFYGFLLVADAIVAPPPGADVLDTFEARELSPGRQGLFKPGSQRINHVYQQTAEGWKFVMPMAGVENAPNILSNETLIQAAAAGKP